MKDYKITIGLEVHLQLNTKSKAFCGCSTEFGKRPNSQVCPVCLGLPGALPVLNRQAFDFALRVALALNCKIAEFTKFDRKNYFYPDLPKSFQISQYDMPLSSKGCVEIQPEGKVKKIGITRVHLEEDTGKLIHQEDESISLVDFNRCGVPLLEIVSEPDINSPDEAYEYLSRLKGILGYLEVSDCDMEKGSLRCDANISISTAGKGKLGTKSEIKNMNSFKAVRAALKFEADRQKETLADGGKIVQETRLWDDAKQKTYSMRSKEEAHDYRYFPEPDLLPVVTSPDEISKIKAALPELPVQKRARFVEDFGITEYAAGVLTADKATADYFEKCAKIYKKADVISNWILGDIMSALNQKGIGIAELNLPAENLVSMLNLIDENKISGKIAKQILPKMIETGQKAEDIVEGEGLSQISDTSALEGVIETVVKENPKPVEDFQKGKETALMFLVGQVMRYTKGKANPGMVNEILRKKLGG